MPIWSRASKSQTATTTTPTSPGDGLNNNNNNDGNENSADQDSLSPLSNGKGPVPQPRKGSKTSKKGEATPPPPPVTLPPPPPTAQLIQKPKLVFHCQQAHGSPTGIISGFTSIKELYEKIAQCYDFPSSEILFCTLNTHKVDMNSLLGGQIGLEDFIFAHRKGQHKEVELSKSEEALGLTITDNGAGYCFIKKIREGSVIDKAGHIHVGDHIEKIDDQNLVGKKHFEVAKMLKEIPKGTTFTIRLIEPLTNGFTSIGARGNPAYGKKANYGSGKQTLRLKATGVTVEEAPDDIMETAVEKINNLLETFLGINDTDLATQIWEMSQIVKNTIDFSEELSKSDLQEFGFTDDFVFDLWGIVSDAKAGRLQR